MRLLWVTGNYPPPTRGGISRFAAVMTAELVRAGHHVHVLALGEQDEEVESSGVKVVRLANGRRTPIPGVHGSLLRRRFAAVAAELVQRERIDVIETVDDNGWLCFGTYTCPVVVRLHFTKTVGASLEGRRVRASMRWCERRQLVKHPHWISVSSGFLRLTQDTFDVTPEKSAVIHNPIVCPENDRPPPDWTPSRFILAVGRVTRQKGALVLAEAARDLLRTDPDLHLVYVGAIGREGGRAVAETIREIVGAQAVDRVHLPGLLPHDQVFSLMRRASVFAFPSFFESGGMAPFEAMRAGTPVVASDLPSIRELSDTDLPRLVPVNDVAALRNEIAELLQNPTAAQADGERGQRYVEERFSVARCLKETVAYYDQVLNP